MLKLHFRSKGPRWYTSSPTSHTLGSPKTLSASQHAAPPGSPPAQLWCSQPVPRLLLARPSVAAAAARNAAERGGSELVDWIVSSGGAVSKVRLKVVSGKGAAPAQREVLASEAIQPGDVLVSVPKCCQLRYDTAHDPLLSSLFEQLPRGSSSGASSSAWQFLQGLALLWHLSKGPASPLRPYLPLLPGLAPGVPTPRTGMLLGDEAVQELQYMPLVQDILNQKYWWDVVWSQTMPSVRASEAGDPFSGLEISREAFGWAVAVTNSRSFGLSKAQTHAMVPLIDMINHGGPAQANCEVNSDWEGTVHLNATKKLAPGDSLLLSYGQHDNRNLLLSYGFVMEGNPSDRFEFEFDLDSLMSLIDPGRSSSHLPAWKLQLLQQLDLIAEDPAPGSDPSAPGASGAPAEATGTSAPPAAVTSGFSYNPRVYLKAGGAAGDAVGKGAGCSSPVDPRLLAALRLLTLGSDVVAAGGPPAAGGNLDSAQRALVTSLTLQQLGGWEQALGRQHELEVLGLLVRLCTALYQSLGSTLQQDRVEQVRLQQLLSASHPNSRTESVGGGSDESVTPGSGAGELAGLDLHRAAAAADTATQDLLLAAQYRISIKSCLEAALQAVVARRKELSASTS